MRDVVETVSINWWQETGMNLVKMRQTGEESSLIYYCSVLVNPRITGLWDEFVLHLEPRRQLCGIETAK
jgi:hypothetical protein